MVDQLDYQELNSLVKHFLEFNGMKDTVQVFEHEVRGKVLANQARANAPKRNSSTGKQRGNADDAGDQDLLNILQVNKVPRNEQ